MDDAPLVGVAQGVADLPRELDGALGVELAVAGDLRPQVLALDVLHRDEVAVGVLVHVVNLHDVVVVQGRDRAGFRQKTLQLAARPGQVPADAFQRDDPAQAPVARLDDDAHAALAQRLQDLIAREVR